MQGVGLVAAVVLVIPHQTAWMPLPVPFLPQFGITSSI